MEHEKLAKKSWNLTNFASELYQICIVFITTKKLSTDLESPHFLTFMENQEMVMEKSWKNILSSLWEPCTNSM